MDKQQNKTPLVRFPEFKGNWEMKRLGEVTNYTKGFAFKSKDYLKNGVRIVRVSDLDARTIKSNNTKIFIDKKRQEQFANYKLNVGDIVITTVGSNPELRSSSVGRGIYVSKTNEGLLNQNLLKFNSNDTYNNKFIFGFINSEKYFHYIKSIKRGNANQANITVKDLLDYSISFPTLPEQQKIAHFFTTIDKKINQLQEKKTHLEQYKKGIMQQIFSQQLRFKDDASTTLSTGNGQDFPEWEVKKLGEVCEINMGQSPSSSSYNSTGNGKYLIQGNADISN